MRIEVWLMPEHAGRMLHRLCYSYKRARMPTK
jgi:hypothetical protein